MTTKFPLESSRLREAEYDLSTRRLLVVFTAGDVYSYDGVPIDVVDALKHSSSPGRFFEHFIRGQFDEELVEKARRPRKGKRYLAF